MARPRTLRDSPRCRVPSLPSGVSASRGHRSLSPRVAHVSLRTPVTVCPHAPRLRSPRPPPLLLPAVCPALSPPTAALSSLLLPDGLASSEPRSVRADGIPGSERSAATATRQRGGRSASRRPGGGERRPPFGRAAERARSAARASPGHPPAHSAPTPPDPLLAPFYPLSPPPSPLSSCRMGWRPRSRGACGQMLSPVRSGTPPTATRQRGGGARRVDRGRGARSPRSAELRSLRDQPPAPARVTRPHIAPPLRLILYLHRSILYPRRPLLSPPAGWAGVLGAAERAGRCYPRFGAARRPPPRVSGVVERAA